MKALVAARWADIKGAPNGTPQPTRDTMDKLSALNSWTLAAPPEQQFVEMLLHAQDPAVVVGVLGMFDLDFDLMATMYQGNPAQWPVTESKRMSIHDE